MRLTDHTENPILSPCLAWFGGGGKKGPSKQEQQAAQQQQADMQAAAQRQAEAQRQQMELQRQQMEEQKRQQAEMLKQMEANKPAPGAQVDPSSAQTDIATDAARRKGMRRSILAGESSQTPMTTGYSTLG